MLLLDLPGKLYKHRYNCFLDWLLLAFPNVRRSSNFKIYFLTQNNKNRKYDNALAPTDFVAKEVRDSDWIILTARHSTVECVLHS